FSLFCFSAFSLLLSFPTRRSSDLSSFFFFNSCSGFMSLFCRGSLFLPFSLLSFDFICYCDLILFFFSISFIPVIIQGFNSILLKVTILLQDYKFKKQLTKIII